MSVFAYLVYFEIYGVKFIPSENIFLQIEYVLCVLMKENIYEIIII